MNPRERIQFLKGSPAVKFENLVIENSNFNFQYSTIPRTLISHVHAALLIAATVKSQEAELFYLVQQAQTNTSLGEPG